MPKNCGCFSGNADASWCPAVIVSLKRNSSVHCIKQYEVITQSYI